MLSSCVVIKMHLIERDERCIMHRLLRFMQSFLFKVLRFPCYNNSLLLRKFSKLNLNEVAKSELDVYLNTSDVIRTERFQWLLCSLSFAYVIKNLLFPIITLTEIDFDDYRNTISNAPRMYDNGYPYFWAVCLYSNCTQFTRQDNPAAKDFRYFPVIPLCYPKLNMLFPPTTWLAPYSLLLHLLIVIGVTFYLILLPIYSCSNPITCDSLMFLLAPNLTRQLMGLDLVKLCNSVRQSYESFRIAPLRASLRFDSAPSAERRLGELDEVRASSYGQISRKIDDYTSDCIPRIRTAHWLKKGAHVFWTSNLMYLMFTITIAILVMSDLIVRCLKKANERMMIWNEIVRTGCNQVTANSDGSLRRMTSNEWLFHFSFFSTIDNVILAWVTTSALGVMSTYNLMIAELNDWRAELEAQYRVLCEVTRVLLFESGGLLTAHKLPVLQTIDLVEAHFKQAKTGVTSQTKGETIFEERRHNRKMHTALCDYSALKSYLPRSSSMGRSIVVDVTAPQQSILDAVHGFEKYMILMEKFYISYRLFHMYVKKCASATYPVTFLTHGLSFGLIVVTLWHSRTVKTFSIEHLFVIVLNSGFSLTFIAQMSDFHAKVSERASKLASLHRQR